MGAIEDHCEHAGGTIRLAVETIACCVWVLFWFDVLTTITNDPGFVWISAEQAFLQITLCMLTMAVVPFGFVAARLIR
jgi:hypothetical protein